MPTVPVVEQTANGAPQYDAPQVAPVRNFAPGQIEALGQSVEQAGTTAMTIGQRMQDQVDEAAVKNAEYNSLSQAQQINSDPQTGFLNQQGQNAVDQYQPAQQGVVKAFKDQLDGLTGHQQRMFQPLMQAHLLSLGQQMSEHDFRQKSQMAADASANRANLFGSMAGNAASSYGNTDVDGKPSGDFAKNVQLAENEALNQVFITQGAPPKSDAANAALLGLHTQIGAVALAQLMNAQTSYTQLQSMYDDMKSKGWFDQQTTDKLDPMVKTYAQQESARAIVNRKLSEAQRVKLGQPVTSTGTPDYQFGIKGANVTTTPYNPELGSVTVNAPVGTNIQAPADGTVTQAGKDDDGNFSMRIEHADGSTTTLAGLTGSNVKVGDQVQGGQNVAASGPSVVWSLTDKGGVPVDPAKAGLPPVDLTKIIDEDVLESALGGLPDAVKDDPSLRQQVGNEMVAVVRQNQHIANAAAAQVFNDASDAFYNGGKQWRNIPPATFAQLPPAQQQQFKDLQSHQILQDYQQAQFFRSTNETGAVNYFLQNPDKLTATTVQQARSQVSNDTYLQLKAKAQEFQSNPQAMKDAQSLNDQTKFYAGQAGVNVDPQTDADKQTLNQITTRVQQGVDQIKAQNNGKATSKQIDDVIQQELIQRVFANRQGAASGETVEASPAGYNTPPPYEQRHDGSQHGPNPGGDFWDTEDYAEPEMSGEPDPGQQATPQQATTQQAKTPADGTQANKTAQPHQPEASLHTSIDGGYTVFEWTDDKGVKHEDRITTLVHADHRSQPGAAGEIHSTVRGVLHGRAARAYGPEGSQIDTGDSRGRWIHGGGTSLGPNHAYDPAQNLTPTYGCTRGHNSDVARLGREITEFQNANPGVQIPYTRTKQ